MLLISLLLLAAPPAQPTDTKVILLLDDLSVVEGEPTKEGYGVRRGKDVEPVPAGRIKFVGDSRDAVHRYLMGQAHAKPPAPPPGVGFEAAALPLFAARVQPVLTNRCGTCHARPDYLGAFKLARVEPGFADAAATERNARAATLVVDRLTPAASPLLAFATTPHGGGKTAPLERSHPAFAPLAQWVSLHAGPQVTKPAARPGGPAPVVSVPVRPAVPPRTTDSTDPGPFNRAVHPGRGS
jgi:hypothetical protein